MIRALRQARFEDVAGVVVLFLFLFAGLWIGAGLGLDAGADQLMQKLHP